MSPGESARFFKKPLRTVHQGSLYIHSSFSRYLSRHSVRAYTDQPINGDTLTVLQQKIDEVNAVAGLHGQLVLDEPKAFLCAMAKYGKFKRSMMPHQRRTYRMSRDRREILPNGVEIS